MMEAIKKLSDRAEFVIILFLVFGLPIFYSLISMIAFLQGYGGPVNFNNFSLLNIFELEALAGCAAGAILYIRFWGVSHFHINMGWLQTLIGIAVLAGDFLLELPRKINLKIGRFGPEGAIINKIQGMIWELEEERS